MGEIEHASELLVEGGRSYPQALAALREFRDLVCTTVREGVTSDLRLLSKSLRVEISTSEIANRARPAELGSSEIDGETANLGIAIRRESIDGWNLYYTLCWYAEEDDPFYFAASIWFKQPSLGEKAYQRLQKIQTGIPVTYADSEIWMKRKLTNGDMAHFPKIVREVIHEWAKAWSRIGGLKAFSAGG